VLFLLAACGGGDDGPSGPPPICHEGTAWDGSGDVFRDKTKAWGLDDMGITGIRFNAVDVDGDGWVDLTVRTGGDAADDFAAGVRNAWLLRNTGEGGFEDVTESSGIRQTRAGDDNRGRPGSVWVWADVDNDGDLDVYTGLPIADEETSELLINQGDWTFALGKKGSPVRDPMAVYGASFTDVDRDGFVDLWLANFGEQSELLLGKGDGGFDLDTIDLGLETEPWVDVSTIDAGLAHSLAWSAAACDLNDDGWPDLLASSYGRAPNHLWQGGSEGFVNRSVDSGYAYDDRVDWTDNESARCHCQLHPDDEDCEGVPPPESIVCNDDDDVFRWDHDLDRNLYRLGGNSGQAVCADLDNDGAVDLVTTEIVHWDVGSSSDPSEILHNTGGDPIVFERPGNEATGLVREHTSPDWNDGDITAEVFDIDNDGWPDVYIGGTDYPGTRGLLYRQHEPLRFEAVPEGHGIDQLRSHGSVAADFDRDGDLDLVVGQSPARCDAECYDPQHPKFFENVSDPGNFLQLELVGGEGTNRAAIGARITIEAGGITQTREVGGGDGQYGDQTDLVQHVGLGEACEAEVTIRWPDQALTTEVFMLGGGYRWRIEQSGSPEVVSPD
jgi:hypothetical protein